MRTTNDQSLFAWSFSTNKPQLELAVSNPTPSPTLEALDDDYDWGFGFRKENKSIWSRKEKKKKVSKRELPSEDASTLLGVEAEAEAEVQPAAEEPVAEELATEEPVAEELATEEPAVAERAAEELVAEEPTAAEPTLGEPVLGESAAEQSVTEQMAEDVTEHAQSTIASRIRALVNVAERPVEEAALVTANRGEPEVPRDIPSSSPQEGERLEQLTNRELANKPKEKVDEKSVKWKLSKLQPQTEAQQASTEQHSAVGAEQSKGQHTDEEVKANCQHERNEQKSDTSGTLGSAPETIGTSVSADTAKDGPSDLANDAEVDDKEVHPPFEVFANSPKHFANCRDIIFYHRHAPDSPITLTNGSLRMEIPLTVPLVLLGSFDAHIEYHVGLIACGTENESHQVMGMLLGKWRSKRDRFVRFGLEKDTVFTFFVDLKCVASAVSRNIWIDPPQRLLQHYHQQSDHHGLQISVALDSSSIGFGYHHTGNEAWEWLENESRLVLRNETHEQDAMILRFRSENGDQVLFVLLGLQVRPGYGEMPVHKRTRLWLVDVTELDPTPTASVGDSDWKSNVHVSGGQSLRLLTRKIRGRRIGGFRRRRRR
ncbi:hypothetical protein K432DRAFT_394699 [Lepidopterella palustris CBS 459.81]|uniref:Uncharacterized protein n=1 Tax=Lepidopterella palustris CBS 459.81 TaxID=1314670 RepID=A0A8E2JDJ7_9PEZI|nr:hypothetical protein K432DRAFT_394699 [Lepidopterella palustris CBS 459.81]